MSKLVRSTEFHLTSINLLRLHVRRGIYPLHDVTHSVGENVRSYWLELQLPRVTGHQTLVLAHYNVPILTTVLAFFSKSFVYVCNGVTRLLVVDDRCDTHNGWDPLKVILENSINC